MLARIPSHTLPSSHFHLTPEVQPGQQRGHAANRARYRQMPKSSYELASKLKAKNCCHAPYHLWPSNPEDAGLLCSPA